MPRSKSKRHSTVGEVIVNTGKWRSRVAIGTATTGLVRMEWAMGRFGQVLPTNWSLTDLTEWITSIAPLRFVVSDAQNIICKKAIEKDAEWLLLIEQDNVLPTDAFLRLNSYMRDGDVPVVSGLYFTKSVPPEAIMYRGSGNSFYQDWKLGDKVWVSGVPTGCLLVHMSLIRAMWNESSEYKTGDQVVRRIFEEPARVRFDAQTNSYYSETGTSDLEWCRRVIDDGFFTKAGWPQFSKKKYPYLVDTNLFVRHIDDKGRQFPLELPKRFFPVDKKKVKKYGRGQRKAENKGAFGS